MSIPSAHVSVVIPALNEARNLPYVFARLPEDVNEVVLVDGHSVDDTVAVARQLRPEAKVVVQTRSGKGNALACGFATCQGDIIVTLDADGSTDAAEIPQFVEALLGGADYVKGSRYLQGGGSDDLTWTRRVGNTVLSSLVNLLFKTDYTDLCYGYNAFWTYCLPALELVSDGPARDEKLWGDGFEIETLINTRIAKADLRITEVPSYERPRIYGESNLNTWRDGLRVLRALLVERINGKGRGQGKRAYLFRGPVVLRGPIPDLPAPREPRDDEAVACAEVPEARTA
jgi:glycosyltransferase involved in cell wall biosynthesis